MRSRYSAFALRNEPYLLKTWHPDTRPESLDLEPSTRWTGLEIVDCSGGSDFHTAGTVTFRARYVSDGRPGVMSEKSSFARVAGTWLYQDGIVSAESEG